MFDMWKNVLSEIEQTIPHGQYATWFADVQLVSSDNGDIVLGVPNVFKKSQIDAKYTDVLKTAFKHNGVEVRTLRIEVMGGVRPKNRLDNTIVKRTVVAPPKVYNNTNERGGSLQTGLNPRYTLDNFVVGSNNDLAVSVARSIVNNPGVSYNPFFLYGGPGLGKTHLVQAIGNAVLENNPKLKVYYTPMSHFYSDFIKALQNQKGSSKTIQVEEFRQKFMKLDMLIVDDFQSIINKDASQNEFFDIFNSLYQANKHIIVTSDRLPEQIKSVDERLASRLTWAGAFDLQLPQFEDRCAILKSKAEFKGVEIEDEAIEYIADNIKTNIRALEGELEHILAVAELKRMTPLEVINEGYMSSINNNKTKTVSPKQVVEKVAKYYQLSVREMCGKSRVANIKNARQVAMYILSKDLGMSTPKIANEVGVKDHTTAMHGIKKIEKDMKLNFMLRDQINEIKEKIYE